MPIRADIAEAAQLFAGERKTLNIDVKQSDGVARQDMTGWSLEWRMFLTRYSTGTPLLLKTVAPSSSLADAVLDRAAVPILAADTQGKHGTFWHELWRIDVESLLSYGEMVIQT